MTSPAYSISFSVVQSGTASTGSAGDVLLPSADDGLYVLATAANRGTRRSTGIALSSYIAGGVVEIQQEGEVSATISGLGAGAATYVRVSAAGALERAASPDVSDDVVGWCETDGTLHLRCGQTPGGYGTAAAATTSTAGSMSAADKAKLDGLQKQGASVEIAALEIDWSLGGVFYKTLAAGESTLTFANATDGWMISVELVGATSTVVWPAGIRWQGGAPPTQSSAGTTLYTLVKSALGISGNAVDVA